MSILQILATCTFRHEQMVNLQPPFQSSPVHRSMYFILYLQQLFWERHCSACNSSPMAFILGIVGHAAISLEMLSSYTRHLLLHLMPSEQKPHRYHSSLQLLPFPFPPHYPTGASKWFITAPVSSFSAFTVTFMLFWYPSKYFQNQHKTVLEIVLLWEALMGWVHLSAQYYNRCSAMQEQKPISLITGKENAGRQIQCTQNQCSWDLPYEAIGIKKELNLFCVYL